MFLLLATSYHFLLLLGGNFRLVSIYLALFFELLLFFIDFSSISRSSRGLNVALGEGWRGSRRFEKAREGMEKLREIGRLEG